MAKRIGSGFAAICAALAVAYVPASASSDPAVVVKVDMTRLASSVQSARAALAPELQVLRSDVARRDAAAVKRDADKLRTDSKALLAAIQRNRHQLQTDVRAARAGGIDVGAAAASNGSGPMAQVRDLQKQLREVLHTAHAPALKPAKTKQAHTHTAKHTKFVKHPHVRTHQYKATHPHVQKAKHKKHPAPKTKKKKS